MAIELPSRLVLVGRVLHEDDDFVTLEIGKTEQVVFHLQQNDEGETVGGDQFLTLVFFNTKQRRFWNPWGKKA